MPQNLNFSISGLYTSMSDINGLPPGALDEAINVEIRYKNLLEPRRGFEGLADSAVVDRYWKRLGNFWINETQRVIGLDDNGDLYYYNGAGWTAIPGDYGTGLIAPNAINSKCRFITAGQNFYVTAADGFRSLSSGTSAEILRAGVPKGLNLEAETNGDADGFYE